MSVSAMRRALLDAAIAYYEAGVERVDDINGVSARLWRGTRLKLAAEKYGDAVRADQFSRDTTRRIGT